METKRIHTRSALVGATFVATCAVLLGMQGTVGTRPLLDRDWDFWSNPPHMSALPTGNVGIGTKAPSARLEVAGLVYSNTGGFQFPDGTVQTTAAGATSYARVFTVSPSGGDSTTIAGALAACVGPGPTNQYLVRVMPGVYTEQVTCKPWVTLQGAGKSAARIAGLVIGANDCTIAGLEITGGILCNATSPTITDNAVTSGADGILIRNGGVPWIARNQITDCAGWGIHCDGWGCDAWILANAIERNAAGGIRCTNSSPTISNNHVLSNQHFGIYLIGALGLPAEPTIDDNVIGRTEPANAGVGIYLTGYAEPRILANDLWIQYTGIEIHPSTQPSILSNNLNYHSGYGIRCFSSGATKPVTIQGNYLHSNPQGGLDIQLSAPIVTHNDIHDNDPTGVNPDVRYAGPPFPTLSLNVFNTRVGAGATGQYNVTTGGVPILP